MYWKEINGYEGYYEVSDEGAVRSLNRTVPDAKTGRKRLTGKEMKLSENRHNQRGGSGYRDLKTRNIIAAAGT